MITSIKQITVVEGSAIRRPVKTLLAPDVFSSRHFAKTIRGQQIGAIFRFESAGRLLSPDRTCITERTCAIIGTSQFDRQCREDKESVKLLYVVPTFRASRHRARALKLGGGQNYTNQTHTGAAVSMICPTIGHS